MLDRRALMLGMGAAALARSTMAGPAAWQGQPPRFSDAPLGKQPPGTWRHQTLPKVGRSNDFTIVTDPRPPVSSLAAGDGAPTGGHVLHAASRASASSWVTALEADPDSAQTLLWRWMVERSNPASDFSDKAGDDYAARVYVLFDLPTQRLSLGARLRHAAAQLLSPQPIPTASICYVWGGSRQAIGSSGWSPYTETVRMVVVDGGDTHAGVWREVRRDLRRDWLQAFSGPMPRVTGLALGVDTDNAGGEAQAWFGDFTLGPA